MTDIEETVRKYALLNAYQHGGKAQPKAVLGKILAENPEFRSQAREVASLTSRIVEEINRLTPERQLKILRERWPESLEARKRMAEEKKLPPLPEAEEGRVVTRFSPNPDCVLHLGSARAAVISWMYAKAYKGRFILRFEDTDPRGKRPQLQFYDSIREDLEWLGCRWDEERIQSMRLPIYYEHAQRLLEKGGAYVCTCKPEKFRSLALAGKPCPCREQPSEVQLERWERMLDGRYREGGAVVRVKTDLSHPNPAVRDWPALRIVDTERWPHPLVGSRFRVWPLYNFSCGLDDHLLGITHIVRGKEHLANEVRQKYLYAHLGWKYPVAVHYGRLAITGAELSKSKIKSGIEEGVFKGYDDPRLATLQALRRRGITPEAVRELMLDVGVKPADVTLSWENLYAHNRKILDQKVDRYFFVDNPVLLKVSGLRKPYSSRHPLHPDHPERGYRILKVEPDGQGQARLQLSSRDLEILKEGCVVRLKNLFNILVEAVGEGRVEARFHSEEYAEARRHEAPIIHFLPEGVGVKASILMPDGSTLEGLAEPECLHLSPGQIIQFERFGFTRIEAVGQTVKAVYGHP
ncbi:MAG: glutamate--tRNA ligase [Candidatus Hecatellaceae archaeon]